MFKENRGWIEYNKKKLFHRTLVNFGWVGSEVLFTPSLCVLTNSKLLYKATCTYLVVFFLVFSQSAEI